MATAYEKANPVLEGELDYYTAREKLGNEFKTLDEPVIIHWYIDGALWVFHVKYYNRRGVCFSNVHNVGGSRYLYCTLFTSSIVKSEDESLVWSESVARDKGVDFKDGFVEFMDEVVANSTDEYIELDDLVL